jgi:hypothetical protein
LKFEIGKQRKTDLYTVLIEIEKGNFNTTVINLLIVELGLSKENYGYWISFTSEFGHGGMTIPKWLLNYYINTGGQLDFSYLIGE